MAPSATDRQGAAAREVHFAIDAVLPSLGVEEADRFAADLTALAGQPKVLLNLLALGRAMAAAPVARAKGAAAQKLVGGGHGELIDLDEGRRRIDAVTQSIAPETWAGSELLGPEAVIERLGVSRSTLHNWRRGGRVIALRKGLRNHVYPMRQFSGSAPLAGIAETLALMSGPEEAWDWLITANPHTGAQPPLALLERGDVEAVLLAANSALDFA